MSDIATTTAGAPRGYFDLKGTHHTENGTLLGFWIYLMSDCLIFASLFATYGVLGRNYAGGPSGAEVFELPLVAVNTLMLLLSSITYGIAMIKMQQGSKSGVLGWLSITGLFGKLGLTAANQRRLMCLSMFWHFLDVVWIAVFTFVYLMGVL